MMLNDIVEFKASGTFATGFNFRDHRGNGHTLTPGVTGQIVRCGQGGDYLVRWDLEGAPLNWHRKTTIKPVSSSMIH